MGSTYETLLVAADLGATVDALRAAGVTAVVVPLAEERVAVLPDEGDRDSAPVHAIGVDLSERLGRPTLATYVFDSVLVTCYVLRGGESVHKYISDQEMLVEWFEDDEAETCPRRNTSMAMDIWGGVEQSRAHVDKAYLPGGGRGDSRRRRRSRLGRGCRTRSGAAAHPS